MKYARLAAGCALVVVGAAVIAARADSEGPDAIEQTMSGLDPAVVVDMEVSTPPNRLFASKPTTQWLHATVNSTSATGADGGDLRSLWEADLAQGAIAERLAADASDLSEVVSGSRISVRHSSGDVDEEQGSAGQVTPGQVFGAQRDGLTDEEIRARITSALDALNLGGGFAVRSVDVLHPLGPAVAVTATVKDRSVLRDQAMPLLEAMGGSREYEGGYLEIDDSTGAPLLRTYGDLRVGDSGVWFAPGIDDLMGIQHGGLAFQAPGSAATR